jgi:hypothetical protein
MPHDEQTSTKLGKKRPKVPPIGAVAHNDEPALSPAQSRPFNYLQKGTVEDRLDTGSEDDPRPEANL